MGAACEYGRFLFGLSVVRELVFVSFFVWDLERLK